MSYTYTRFKTLRQGQTLFLLCWAAYTCAYVGRYNYSAVMPAILAEGSLGLTQAGTVSTVYFVLYAVGQVIGGILCQKISPYSMVFSGLALSGLCNFGMACMPAHCMVIFWAANGLFQAAVWPPIVRLFAECMPLEQQKSACVGINSTTPVGTLISYGISALLLAVSGWRMAFVSCGVILLVMALVWAVSTRSMRTLKHKRTTAVLSARDEKEKAAGGGAFAKLLLCGLGGLLFPVMLHGALKDGVTSWVPSMIQNNFEVLPAFSAVLSMLLPVVNLAGAYGAGWLDQKIFRNEMKTVACLFMTASISLLLLLFAVRAVWSCRLCCWLSQRRVCLESTQCLSM